MKSSWSVPALAVALSALAIFPARAGSDIANIVPGRSSKADVRSLLGAPWRILQFNDCGMAMDDQADETWEYRGTDASGGYRIHVEFGDNGDVHLIAKIPDATPGGKATAATIAPAPSKGGMSM
jgi:hypothetical protein